MQGWNGNTNKNSKGNCHDCRNDSPGTIICSFYHTAEEITD